MNCQKFSLEACTHAAQNERLPLRVIVQVLFFEQLRLRTTIAGWFFVSDNMDSSRRSHSNIRLSKNSNNSRMIQTEICEDQKAGRCNDDENEVNMDDDEEVRSRISQLERECWSLKQELEKMGKGEGFWKRFCSKLGLKSRHHYQGKQVFMEC